MDSHILTTEAELRVGAEFVDEEYMQDKVIETLKRYAEIAIRPEEIKLLIDSGALRLTSDFVRNITEQILYSLNGDKDSYIATNLDNIRIRLNAIAQECSVPLDLLMRGMIYYGTINDAKYPYNVQGKVMLKIANLIEW